MKNNGILFEIRFDLHHEGLICDICNPTFEVDWQSKQEFVVSITKMRRIITKQMDYDTMKA
jgi:hypothetical protein